MAEDLRRIALPAGMSTRRTNFSQALCHCFDCRKTFDKLDLTTDDSGYLNLIHPVSSLAIASFTLRLPDGSTSTIDPSGNVVAALSAMNKSDLGNDTYVDADGKTQNPVATGTSDEAVMGVAKGLQMLCIKLPQLHRAAAVKAGLQVPGVALAAKVAEQDGDFFSDLSDIVQWIINVVEDVASIVFEAVDARPLW
jgi:hypothetical protein